MTNKSTVNDSQLHLEKMGIEQKISEKLLSFKNEDDEFLYDISRVSRVDYTGKGGQLLISFLCRSMRLFFGFRSKYYTLYKPVSSVCMSGVLRGEYFNT
jgi:hypothetical protein